jgi:hypothetical protein
MGVLSIHMVVVGVVGLGSMEPELELGMVVVVVG